MRTTARAALCAAALASLALLASCAAPWRDAMGRPVQLPEGAARIASLAPSATEILYAIGAQDRLVGVSNQCDYPVAAKLKPKIGDFNRPDLEKVTALRPDVVLFAEYVRPDDLAALERIGVRSVVLPARDLADLSATIRLVGRIAGRVEQAEGVAGGLERTVAAVAGKVAAVPPEKRPGVYIEVDGPATLYAVGSGSFMGDVVRVAGGRNVFGQGAGPYIRVTPEEVIRANPDVILVDHPFQYKVGVAKRPGWDTVAAVRGGRVYDGTDFDMVALNRASPRVASALREVARLFHPALFPGR
jgi:iron complex transport system substrate-binding protein